MLLRDPNLPEALLPQDWPGRTAREMCSAMYGALLAASEDCVQRTVEVADGKLADAGKVLRSRFVHG
ncbi:PaaX family transcriptional regulator C-terminal domain-containing protein [Cupriavidus alkaliphilus]|uniref:PaaX family transcriptional regulator C-terminal domain-containing protein n=1 Tax=Cupriavidus alkaliphilus TaxID=942866 RepID=UPI001821B572|nr:PaaX family transcriptional regulator C-terminal domain-containing protein [Cupriavidus alkaliphilus]MBB3013287.1 DNA-binding transcriptional regulator PaaX [Cupriavidus alkaliphilus]